MRQSWEPRKEPQGRWGTASRRHADTSGGRVQPVPVLVPRVERGRAVAARVHFSRRCGRPTQNPRWVETRTISALDVAADQLRIAFREPMGSGSCLGLLAFGLTVLVG